MVVLNPSKRTVFLALGYHLHEFHTGIARFAKEAGWVLDRRLMFVNVLDPEPMRLLSGVRWDGVIAFLTAGTPALNELVQSAGVPIVDLSQNISSAGIPKVLQDNYAAGRLGAEYFLSRGFRRLLFYSTLGRPNARERYAGFAAAAAAAGRESEILVWESGRHGSSYGETGPWLAAELASRPAPLAVMAEDDWAAVHVLEACELAGFDVPGQVAVLGVDDDPVVQELARVPLSSVATCREEVAYRAAALLDEIMRGASPPPTEPIRVSPERVVTRRSTDAYAVEDERVLEALSFIRQNLHRPIAVDDVAEHIGIARRTLQMAFQSELRRPVAGEIARLRVERAKALLVESDLKGSAIAVQCGFGSAARMGKVFVRLEGVVPSRYRERERTRASIEVVAPR